MEVSGVCLDRRPLLHMCTCDIINHQYILSGQNRCFLSLQGPKVKQADVGKFVELPGAEKGKVVVRFPPEASG